MTLKTSSRKINPFVGMIKSTYRKNFGIIIVLCIMALLFCPGGYVVNFQRYYLNRFTLIEPNGTTPAEFTHHFGSVIAAFAPLFVMIFNFVNFSYLYKKNSSDVFHSFPLTRAELLLSRMIAGVLSALTPVALCTGCYIVTIILHPWLGSFGTLLYYLILTVVITLLWTAFSMIFVVCAGSAFDLSLSFFGVNVAIMLISLIANSIFRQKLLGYNNDSIQILKHVSLPFFCATHKTAGFWIKSIIYIAAFTTIAILLYNRRKAEKGGTAYAYKFMYYACSVLASICGGWLVGILFEGSSIDFTGVFWFFALIGAILFALIYGLITNRGFKGAKRSLILGGVAWCLLLTIFISSTLGGFGFTGRVPNKNRVKEVTVTAFGEDITFTNPDIVLKLHEKTIKNAINSKNLTYIDDSETVQSDSQTKTYISFAYTLKGGGKMHREFFVPLSSVSNELLAVFKSEERYKCIIEDSCINDPNIITPIKLEHDEWNNEYTNYITKEEYQELLEAYWQDVQYIYDIEDMRGNESMRFIIDYENRTHNLYLEYNSYFDNTCNLLEHLKSSAIYSSY